MQYVFRYQKLEIAYTLERRNRKTLGITIQPSGAISVLAPYDTSQENIEKILQKKSAWIHKKLRLRENQQLPQRLEQFCGGERLPYLGHDYTLVIVNEIGFKQCKVMLEDTSIRVHIASTELHRIREILEKWYKLQAETIFEKRMLHFMQHFPVQPRKIRIKSQKNRWGSCSVNQDLNLNWRCILAPLDIVDYVLVHELTHLLHMNHSKAFWKALERVIPDYKIRHQWLRQNGMTLDF